VAFESSVVDFFIEAADLLGVPKSVAAIYGICFASPEPLGFSEINERLDISSGSISQGLRFLRETGALKVSDSTLPLANSRQSGAQRARERFEPDMELRKLAMHFIEHRLEKQFDAGKGRLDRMEASIANGNGASEIVRTRLQALKAWHSQGRAVLPIVKTFLKLT
jgi:hypothetical protein